MYKYQSFSDSKHRNTVFTTFLLMQVHGCKQTMKKLAHPSKVSRSDSFPRLPQWGLPPFNKLIHV